MWSRVEEVKAWSSNQKGIHDSIMSRRIMREAQVEYDSRLIKDPVEEEFEDHYG